MSSILSENSTAAMLEFDNLEDGLDIIGKQNEVNRFEILDSEDGASGNDNVIGGGLADAISAGAGDDNLIGGAGEDDLSGGAGSDLIRGGLGDDNLFGDEGDDILSGGDGFDILNGGSGVDILSGGDGSDVFEFFAEDFAAGEVDIITDFEDGDIIKVTGVDGSVSYSADTGYVSVDGENIINLGEGLDVTANDADDNGTWELF